MRGEVRRGSADPWLGCESHLHSGTHRCQGIHLREAHGLAVHSLGLLDHDGGAGLALGPGRGWRVGWLGLQREAGQRQSATQSVSATALA